MLQLCSSGEADLTSPHRRALILVLPQANSPQANSLFGLLGLGLGPITGLVGCKRWSLRLQEHKNDISP
jgi:hypothetical protein